MQYYQFQELPISQNFYSHGFEEISRLVIKLNNTRVSRQKVALQFSVYENLEIYVCM